LGCEQVLDLAFNSLTGLIPEELASLNKVISFTVEDNSLSGPIPTWFGNWKSVSSLLLSKNMFNGSIPIELGNLPQLQDLALDNNMLSGSIPSELCNALSLEILTLSKNKFTGSILETFQECTNLTQIDLTSNELSGPVPPYLGELPELLIVSLGSNNFSGSLPDSLWSSKTLLEIQVDHNNLTGSLSPLVGTLLTLQNLVLDNNHLEGPIPLEIGKLLNLTVLSISSNFLSGSIPVELCSCIHLTTLNLGSNMLTGEIPNQIGELINLDYLVLSHNNITGQIPSGICADFQVVAVPVSSFLQHYGTLDLSWNNLLGNIPPEMGNCVVLVELILAGNQLTGNIPPELAQLTNLTTLDLSSNSLTGSIPPQFGESHKLQGLNLAYNKLTGEIPAELGDIVSLVQLNLTGNCLSGPIPYQLGNLVGLSHLDLSNNQLIGNIPASFENLGSIVILNLQNNQLRGTIASLLSQSAILHQTQTLNLSHNSLFGAIPPNLGNLTGLSYLDLHANHFFGAIPSSLGGLTQLMYLDLSENQLSGDFPESLCNLEDLVFFNISSNEIGGTIPNTGVCRTFSVLSFAGNNGLCDLATPCGKQASSPMGIGDIFGITIGIVVASLTIVFAAMRWQMMMQQNARIKDAEKTKLTMGPGSCVLEDKDHKEPLSINVAMFEWPLLRLMLADILQATNNFCKTNIIGDGGFGTVYKAVLPDGRTVAIKKLGQARTQGNREFLAEMETLGKVKHQNLVPLLGYCAFGEEKLLVYEYMVNGSLDIWLRNRADAIEVLDWPKRFKIAMGSARGLAFLHHGFIPHIIHRDMKASNILLDSDFEPRIADFGLARLISAYDTHVSTDIAGTFGYIPPEYGQSWRSTTRGDVYSYGVILLELLTGKEPTGADFKEIEGGNLVGWVHQMIKEGKGPDVLDFMTSCGPSKIQMLKVLHIATLCTAEDPLRRPTMQQVVKSLKDAEDAEEDVQHKLSPTIV
jgi:Leucine-rich repeat (LRR) protein